MGVRGLFLYCSEKHPQIAVEYNLLDIALDQGNVEVIIDFYAFEYWISQQVSNIMAANTANPWVELSGGEYSVIHSLVSSFINFLKEGHVRPTFVMDGAKFSTSAQAHFKFDEWVRRDNNDYMRVKKMLDMVSGATPLGSMNRREYVRLVLIETEIVRCIRALGVEIHCCCSGEADMYIVKLFTDRRAFAIISNDSDFLLFPNCCLISLDSHFDLDNHLRRKLKDAYALGQLQHLDRLLVRCVKSNDVAGALQLENIDQICDFAFVRGNDASKKFTDTIHATLKVSPNDFTSIVNFVRQNQPLIREPIISAMCRSTNGFREAYEMTHNFYKLNFAAMPSDSDHVINPELERFVCLGVSRLNLPPNMLSISRGYHWCRVLVEVIKFQAYNPVSELAMAPFRSFLYHMTLTRKLPAKLATEFLVLPKSDAKKLQPEVPVYSWLPRVNEIPGVPFEQRLELFHKIMTHQETGKPGYRDPTKIYLEIEDFGSAFRTYVCRYFWLQNFHRNLHVSREELLAVISTVFGTTSGTIEVTQSVPCKPSPRSLTVAAWLQNIYRYAGTFLARMLDLDKGIPAPRDFFSGSVFTAFFYCDLAEDPTPEIKDICNIKANVLRENINAVHLILNSP